MPDVSKPNVSIVVPCYNSASYIGQSLDILVKYVLSNEEQLGRTEILVVDDGSRDGTCDLVARKFPEVTLIHLESNQGKGAAVRRGMLAATGVYRFFVDVDMPFDLIAIAKMLHYLDFKEFDVCIGVRNVDQCHHLAQRTWLRRTASLLFTEVVSRIVVTGVRDTQCGLKGFRADVAEYLFSQSRINGFAFDVEVLYLAYKNNLDVKRIPVTLIREDPSTISVFRHGTRMLFSIACIPLRYYMGAYMMMTDRHGRGGV